MQGDLVQGDPDDDADENDELSSRTHRRRDSTDSIPLPASDERVTTEFSGPMLALPDDDDALHSEPPETARRAIDETLSLAPPPPPPSEPPTMGNPQDVLATIPPAPPQSGALALVERSRGSSSGLDLVSEMRERFDLDDFSGALRAAELMLGRQSDHPEAQRIAQRSREALERLCLSRLGTLASKPRVDVDYEEIRWLGLDHRAGFLLSRIDGEHSVEDLLAISGMPRFETLKTLVDLLGVDAITIED